MSVLMLLLLGILILLVGGGLLAACFVGKHETQDTAVRSLPGQEGGGCYVMQVEGLQTAEDCAKLETALNRVPHTHSVADSTTGEVHIHYEGFPALNLLEQLQKQAEQAGFSVKHIA